MKKPKKINILGFNYKVLYEETEKMRNLSWAGAVNNWIRVIYISPEYPEEMLFGTLMHEIIHAIDYITSGSSDITLSEEQTEKLAVGLESLLTNNKVIEWL